MEHKNAKQTPPRKYQPRGLTILHEDQDIIVVNKINGLLTMSTGREHEKTAYSLLTDYVKKGNSRSRNRIFIVHRLDKDTSGVLVFAKHEKAKRFLQDNWQEFSKTYMAVVHGVLHKKEDVITSYLTENKLHRMYSTNQKGEGKFSKTGYKVIRESKYFSLLEIDLYTGTKNQIRVHLYEAGHPVAGDKMYGERDKSIKRLALHAASLKIKHPYSREEMTFSTELPVYLKSLLKQ
ncbi:RluA family pseudouridine synthase [Saccharicrinis sp. FJH54]|uniref:RluA family pseudouridine synthase n=1 Tax=Saccharicrinis sp. FJH54 TaxID=3344665 RepID=UPI0035D45D87